MSNILTCHVCQNTISLPSADYHEGFCYCDGCQQVIAFKGETQKVIEGISTVGDEEFLSPFYIGCLGKYNQEEFYVTGLLRCFYEEGYYRNQWGIYFKNGEKGWLLESNGTYAVMYSKAPSSRKIPANIKAGKRMKLY